MEKLQTVYGSCNVYINKLASAEEGIFYHVSFVDKKNKAHILLVRYDYEVSVILQKEIHPNWILALEGQLHQIIKNLAENQYQFARAV